MIKFFNKKYLNEFIFKQKCIPYTLIKRYRETKARLFNVNSRKYWDKIWNNEISSLSERRLYPKMYSEILKLIPERTTVLDVGCGMGILMERIKSEKKCHIIGIDISAEAVRYVINRGMLGIMTHVPPIPLPSQSCDVVIATELLEHLSKPKIAIKEILRVLKKGGIYILSIPENAGPQVNKEHLKDWTITEIKKILKPAVSDIRIKIVKEKFESHNLIISYGIKKN